MTADRAERSVLATPGSNPRMIARALASDADVVMIDLEDAVTPDAKAAARSTVAEALREGDWRGRPRTFRMNALDTPWFIHDLTEVVEGAQGRVDLIVVPKVGSPEDVHTVATVLASLEVAAGAKHPIGLETQIESAAGLAQCEAIAVASPRVEALVFGPGDYAASINMPLTAIGMPDRWDTDYPGGSGWLPPLLPDGARARLRRQMVHPPRSGPDRQRGLHSGRGGALLGARSPGRERPGRASGPRVLRLERPNGRRGHPAHGSRHASKSAVGRSLIRFWPRQATEKTSHVPSHPPLPAHRERGQGVKA
ncbi:MAG: Citryl-CoA lyase [Thermomicrobiales bacterium]|nr:Citryl-CoA lyase [Thermomicrobiales bacterium]